MNRLEHTLSVLDVRKRIEQFDYKEKPSFEKYRALKIMLPIDKTGQPDWAYMEEYMRKVEERVNVMMGKYEMTVNEAAL